MAYWWWRFWEYGDAFYVTMFFGPLVIAMWVLLPFAILWTIRQMGKT